MRKKFSFICSLICVSFLLIGCNNNFSIKTEAQVLSINENILAGKSIGSFLGSASGHISNDINKIGVKIEVFDRIFLKDLRVSHAILAYYRNENKLPVTLDFCTGYSDNCKIRILEECVYSFDLNWEIYHYLRKKQIGANND